MRSATHAGHCRPSCCACCRTGEFERLGGTRDPRGRRALRRGHPPRSGADGERGEFREDLFYRLNVVPVVAAAAARAAATTSPSPRSALPVGQRRRQRARGPQTHAGRRQRRSRAEQRWPGNVRQLSNFIERLVVLSDSLRIDEAALQAESIVPCSSRPIGAP